MSSKADKLDNEAGQCAASYGFETCYQCEGHFSRSGSCELSMALATETFNEFNRDLSLIKSFHKKYGEPYRVAELMTIMGRDERLTKRIKEGIKPLGNLNKLFVVYQKHCNNLEFYNNEANPYWNAINLNTAVEGLINCIMLDIADLSPAHDEEGD